MSNKKFVLFGLVFGVLFLAVSPLLDLIVPSSFVQQIDTSKVGHKSGSCYTTRLQFESNWFMLKTDTNSGKDSILHLFEDGKELGDAHSAHSDIGEKGRGRYSHWTDQNLYFSASDNSDPRENKKQYTVRSALTPIVLLSQIRFVTIITGLILISLVAVAFATSFYAHCGWCSIPISVFAVVSFAAALSLSYLRFVPMQRVIVIPKNEIYRIEGNAYGFDLPVQYMGTELSQNFIPKLFDSNKQELRVVSDFSAVLNEERVALFSPLELAFSPPRKLDPRKTSDEYSIVFQPIPKLWVLGSAILMALLSFLIARSRANHPN